MTRIEQAVPSVRPGTDAGGGRENAARVPTRYCRSCGHAWPCAGWIRGGVDAWSHAGVTEGR